MVEQKNDCNCLTFSPLLTKKMYIQGTWNLEKVQVEYAYPSTLKQ